MNRSSLDELKLQCTRFETKVQIRLNEIYAVVCQLPNKLRYTTANSVKVLDYTGRETIIPTDFCETRAQFHEMLDVIALKWPQFARAYIRSRNFWTTCEDSRKLLFDEESWAVGIAAGRTIRVSGITINNYKKMPGGWDVVTRAGDPYNLTARRCEVCARNSPR